MGPINGRACVGSDFRIPKLDRKQDDIDRPDVGRIVGHLRILEMQIAERAFDDQSIVADGVEMRSARDEGHVVARGRHARAEISADRARRHCCNPHEKIRPVETGRIIQI